MVIHLFSNVVVGKLVDLLCCHREADHFLGSVSFFIISQNYPARTQFKVEEKEPLSIFQTLISFVFWAIFHVKAGNFKVVDNSWDIGLSH